MVDDKSLAIILGESRRYLFTGDHYIEPWFESSRHGICGELGTKRRDKAK